MKTGLCYFWFCRSVFIFPEYSSISNISSNYFVLSYATNSVARLFKTPVCLLLCNAQSATVKKKKCARFFPLQCWKALKIRDHAEGETGSLFR
jgi:hypothetical protein